MGSLLLLLLLLLETLRKPIIITLTSQTIIITITITFPLLLHLLLLLNQKKHNTSRLQSNIQRPLSLPWYHRHIITDNIIIKLSENFVEYFLVIGKVIVYYWQMLPPITITITGTI